jgi:hypothetical protein
LEPSVPVTVIV